MLHDRSCTAQGAGGPGYRPPAPPEPLLQRERLVALLNQSLQRPLTLVAAPAGFGKTALLSAWARTLPADAPQVAWLTLDAAANDPLRFWAALAAALGHQPPAPAPHVPPPPISQVVTALINSLAKQAATWLLVLDNYERITDSAVQHSLVFLIEHLPPQLHLVIATRSEPHLPLGNLRARGKLLELRADHLRCTPDEAAAFLGEVLRLALAPAARAALIERAGGWFVGLLLLAAQPHDQEALPAYIREQVLHGLPGLLQRFLLHTSILDLMCAPLCDALLGAHDSQALLDQLVRDNLFVTLLHAPRRWYRYQPLFAQGLLALLRQQQPASEPALHMRASDWYAAAGMAEDAVHHALLAQNDERAAELIETAIRSLSLKRGQNAHLLAQLQLLPTPLVRARPTLCLFRAEGYFVAGQLAEVEVWMRAATEALMRQGAEAAYSPQERQYLLRTMRVHRAVIAAYFGRWQVAEELCRQIAAELHDGALDHEIGLLAAQARSALAHNQPMLTVARLIDLNESLEASGALELALSTLTFATPLLLLQGRLREAWRTAHQAAQVGTDANDMPLADVGAAYIYQAEVLREWNRLDEAADRVEEGRRLLEQSSYTILQDHMWLVQARIALARGDLAAAQEHLDALARHPLVAHNPYQRAWMLSGEQVRLWLAGGDLQRAARWARELHQAPRHPAPFARSREDLALARVALALGQPDAALSLLASPLAAAQAAERRGDAIAALLLSTRAHQQRGDEPAAISTLARALLQAEPEGAIRPFVEEGPALRHLLTKLQQARAAQQDAPFIAQVVQAF